MHLLVHYFSDTPHVITSNLNYSMQWCDIECTSCKVYTCTVHMDLFESKERCKVQVVHMKFRCEWEDGKASP